MLELELVACFGAPPSEIDANVTPSYSRQDLSPAEREALFSRLGTPLALYSGQQAPRPSKSRTARETQTLETPAFDADVR